MARRFPQALVSTCWLGEQLKEGTRNLRVFDCTQQLDTSNPDIKPYVVKSGLEGFKAGRIPTAEYFDITDFSVKEPGADTYGKQLSFQMLDGKEFIERLGDECGLTEDSHVVLYSQTKPMWATRVWWMLYSAGFPGVFSVLDGGLGKWKGEERELETGEPEKVICKPHKMKQGDIPPQAFSSKADVMKVMECKGPLVHALPKPSFDGANANYGRAGHIPGAVNMPFPSLLNADNYDTFKSAEETSAAFAAAGFKQVPSSFHVYCGAGISATLPLFAALNILDWDKDTVLSLYDGSLSEWCADDACPLEICA
eukprot:TRINITY_DN822_c8_g1_i1.p1 TRINITY_DN822_c8_g1~~TRINITY_DN822_c8_g1_i1.p1  ORF type:complete len:326 (+),score=96.32 TRINITY_DN822_c8_g1_i1:48-980(+)